jgi:hypothetical protein
MRARHWARLTLLLGTISESQIALSLAAASEPRAKAVRYRHRVGRWPRSAAVGLGSSPIPLPKPSMIAPNPAVSGEWTPRQDQRETPEIRASPRFGRLACEASALPLSYAPWAADSIGPARSWPVRRKASKVALLPIPCRPPASRWMRERAGSRGGLPEIVQSRHLARAVSKCCYQPRAALSRNSCRPTGGAVSPSSIHPAAHVPDGVNGKEGWPRATALLFGL